MILTKNNMKLNPDYGDEDEDEDEDEVEDEDEDED